MPWDPTILASRQNSSFKNNNQREASSTDIGGKKAT
jgi:hypothetical protein